MSYVEDLCLALVRVLEHAAFHKDRVSIAGFTANIDFWAGEIRHAMDCLAGYETRFERLRTGRLNEAQKLNSHVEPELLNATLSQQQLERLQRRLHQASVTFLRACREHLDLDKQSELEILLGLQIKNRRPMD